MSRIFQTIITVVWGLWFGGLVMLFLAVSALFKTFGLTPELAGAGASRVFSSFNRYRLILAAVSLLLTFTWWLLDRNWQKVAIFTFISLAVLSAVYTSAFLTPGIERLRVAEMTHTTAFKHLHGLSMGLYLLETLFILLAGLFIPPAHKPRPIDTV